MLRIKPHKIRQNSIIKTKHICQSEYKGGVPLNMGKTSQKPLSAKVLLRRYVNAILSKCAQVMIFSKVDPF